YLLQKVGDDAPNPWPVDTTLPGDPTQWVRDHTRIWIFKEAGSGKYYWRGQIALPIRSGAAPNKLTAWSSPSIYLDNIFATDATKNKPPFWLDMITAATDGGAVPLTNKHFPDWVDDATAPRDATYSIPSISAWGTGEMGS